MSKRINLASYYLLPLMELSVSSFGDAGDIDRKTGRILITEKSNFVDCYLSTENFIVVRVKDFSKVPNTSIANSHYFSDVEVEDEGEMTTLIIYRVSAAYLEDVLKFRTGKYSRMRDIAKDKIVIFNHWDNQTDKLQNNLFGALYRSLRMRTELEEKYEIKLSPEDEVKSIPDEDNFIDLSNSYKEISTL